MIQPKNLPLLFIIPALMLAPGASWRRWTTAS